MKALARPLDERYQSAQELHDDLEEFARAEGIPTGARALKEMMQGLFAERITALKEAERQGRDYADAYPEPTPDEAGSDSALAVSRTPTSRQIPRPRRRTVWPIWAAAGSLVVAAGVVLLIVVGGVGRRNENGSSKAAAAAETAAGAAAGASPPSTAAARDKGRAVEAIVAADAGPPAPKEGPSAPKPAAEAPKPTKVTVEIETTPKGAKVYLGDKLLGTTPAKVELDHGDKPVTLELRLAGYHKLTQDVVPDKDARIVTVLQAQPRRRRPANADEIVDPWK
jgi:hypothetical protein